MSLYTYKAKLKKVVDGDTIDVYIDLGFDIHYFSRVRLAGINTPESRTKNLEEKKLGLAAKEFVDQWLQNNGPEFIIKTGKEEKGKYGRVLGTIYTMSEDKCLNTDLIDEGLAREYDGQGNKTWTEFKE
ncbi:MAG: thermonuclease family protein [Proteobacteria bacterium]|nr:thermonuclease family protein [Pseudomonadota bacterium]